MRNEVESRVFYELHHEHVSTIQSLQHLREPRQVLMSEKIAGRRGASEDDAVYGCLTAEPSIHLYACPTRAVRSSLVGQTHAAETLLGTP